MMCKRLIVLLLVLAFAGSGSAANMYWIGGSTDWTDAANWGGTGSVPTAADFLDIRHDAWVANFPVIGAAQTGTAGVIRMNPGYGAARTVSITVDGGTLNVDGQVYVSNVGGDADFILNSGTVNVGLTSNKWMQIGAEGANGRLFVNGGTLNSGTLGIPQWWSTPGTGQVFIDGGQINTNGIMMGGAGNAIEFTKDFSAGGGRIVDTQDINNVLFADWQTAINALVSGNQIFSTATSVQVNYSSVGTVRTTEIFAVPEPMTMALLGVGCLALRRKRRSL